jgi:Ca2+/H+ antiporter, TMEM165/GDT1 family
MRRRFNERKFAGFFFLALAGVAAFSLFTMLLWNALMPVIFHLPLINFGQALGLLLLSKILFSGFRGGGGFRGRWKGQAQQRWMDMTPEDREKFKQEWGRRCGIRDPKPAEKPFTSE